MSEIVRSVERAIDILSCFSVENPNLTVPEISKMTGLTKSTVFRLLASLESKRMIEKISSTHEYKLGIKLLDFGNVVQSSLELRSIAMPVMKGLSDRTKETININIVQGSNRVCIDRIDGNQALRKVSEVGKLLPLHKGASGKLLLAFSNQDKLIEVIKENEGDMSESDRKKLKIELGEIKEIGYATSFNERLDGTASISAPIRDYSGEVIAGLTLSGPYIRFTDEKVEYFIKEVKESSEKISKELGFSDEAIKKNVL